MANPALAKGLTVQTLGPALLTVDGAARAPFIADFATRVQTVCTPDSSPIEELIFTFARNC